MQSNVIRRHRAGGLMALRIVAVVLAAAVLAGVFAPGTRAADKAKEAVVIQGLNGVKQLDAAQAYEPKDNVVAIEISEYAGYAGLIAANGGMEPNENSVFFKKGKFKVKLTVSEEESWNALNTGKMAASATTADVLAAYGKQFQVIVPAQIGYSRGADAIVVNKDITRINALKGKVISTAQFTESDFLIRYLAQEAGVPVNMLPGLDAKPDPDKINLVFCADGEAAGEVYLKDLKAGGNKLAGCVTWEPETSKVVSESSGKAHILTTNRNLLIVADVLVVNKGFAEKHPEMVGALVEGLLEGNRLVRDKLDDALIKTIGDSFKWDAKKTKEQLAMVHLANLPENLAFFGGSMDSAGSWEGIYDSAVLAYGTQLIKNPADPDTFARTKWLKDIDAKGDFKEQKVAIAPIRTAPTTPVEKDPLLSKDIRFFFEPNSSNLDMTNKDNLTNLDALKKMLSVAPGSQILLRGHVDNSQIPKFREKGGDALVQRMALQAMKLSKDRAAEVKKRLIERTSLPEDRIETVGRGWEEPAGTDPDKNRRVEAQWFTIE